MFGAHIISIRKKFYQNNFLMKALDFKISKRVIRFFYMPDVE